MKIDVTKFSNDGTQEQKTLMCLTQRIKERVRMQQLLLAYERINYKPYIKASQLTLNANYPFDILCYRDYNIINKFLDKFQNHKV